MENDEGRSRSRDVEWVEWAGEAVGVGSGRRLQRKNKWWMELLDIMALG